MWDETDYTARWIQGICAVLLALFAFADAYFILHSPGFWLVIGGGTVFLASVRVAWRCFVYALTGRNNINRDNY